MAKLVCTVCGSEKEVPTCCDESMILQGSLLCCCSDKCHHRQIPKCCGKQMEYV